jgi:hypothetical protein
MNKQNITLQSSHSLWLPQSGNWAAWDQGTSADMHSKSIK